MRGFAGLGGLDDVDRDRANLTGDLVDGQIRMTSGGRRRVTRGAKRHLKHIAAAPRLVKLRRQLPRRQRELAHGARELGLGIPGDVSISGYDDHPMSALLTPALTTMDWDVDRIVRAAVRLVLAAIERKPHRRRTVQAPRLRERHSTGPPATG